MTPRERGRFSYEFCDRCGGLCDGAGVLCLSCRDELARHETIRRFVRWWYEDGDARG